MPYQPWNTPSRLSTADVPNARVMQDVEPSGLRTVISGGADAAHVFADLQGENLSGRPGEV